MLLSSVKHMLDALVKLAALAAPYICSSDQRNIRAEATVYNPSCVFWLCICACCCYYCCLYGLYCIVCVCDRSDQTIATEELVPTLAKPVPEQVILKEGGVYPTR